MPGKAAAWLLLLPLSLAPLCGNPRPASWLAIAATGALGWLFSALCWRSGWSRILAVLGAALWALNLTVSLLCKAEYDSPFVPDMAAAVLQTNPAEAAGMAGWHWVWFPVFAAAFAAALWVSRRASRTLPVRLQAAASVALAVLGAAIFAHNFSKRGAGVGAVAMALTKTPFYNAGTLLRAAENAGGWG
jgi:glucan phosphoethanolaminetransferase (alkaline phosphatase superfamily)